MGVWIIGCLFLVKGFWTLLLLSLESILLTATRTLKYIN